MNIKPENIIVHFTNSHYPKRNKGDDRPLELSILVHGLYPRTERTDQVISKFCQSIGEAVEKTILESKYFSGSENLFIEVIPYFVRSGTCDWRTSKN
jgi:hypothetical protein